MHRPGADDRASWTTCRTTRCRSSPASRCAKKIATGQLLPLPRAVRVLRDVASAIAHAHEHGVAHRDLKPDNVLLSSGYAVVTDFGIAKAVSSARSADDPELTSRGMTVGTPAYMAPEQATADPAADHRVDMYALGVMAYEILTGQRPFTARTAQELLVAHITKTPTPHHGPAAGSAVAALVARHAVSREVAGRPSVGAAGGRDTGRGQLRRRRRNHGRHADHANHARTPRCHPIAVLPFVNLTGNADNDYLADGIAEEILNALARLRTMHVAARSSSFAFRGSSIDLRAVGERLGVRTVLEGSVRRSGNRLRVTVQLADVASGFQLWSERYDREDEDVFDIEDQIAASVVETLKVTLAEHARRAARAATDHELRGVQAVPARPTCLESGRARGSSARSTCSSRRWQLDPEFALAHAGVADVFILAGIFERWRRPRRSRSRASPRERALDARSVAVGGARIVRCDQPVSRLGLPGGPRSRWSGRSRSIRAT